jgi:FlaA1/EpsC-like NDP-sugar epimerase
MSIPVSKIVNKIYIYSRDESKHWSLEITYNYNSNLKFIIGDVRDKDKVEQTIMRVKPNIIIIAAAMKHIERCEYETNECIATNLLGTKNILDVIETAFSTTSWLESVCFISTDKACSPVNIYGMCKAISEGLMVEKSRYIPSIKFVTVRYGNVLNSRGSIIPTLHKVGCDPNIPHFNLTNDGMTRFIMTLKQSVKLIEHAILKASSGDIVIPNLVSMNVKDLLEIFSELYKKPVVISKLRPGEKMLESLINETQSCRIMAGENGYTYICPNYKSCDLSKERTIQDYNSTINPLSKQDLYDLLKSLNLFDHDTISL